MQKLTNIHSTYLHSLWTASTSLVQTGESPHRFVVRWSAADGSAGRSLLPRCYLWTPNIKVMIDFNLISTSFHWELVTDPGSLPPWWWGLVSPGSLILRCGRLLLRWRWPHPPLWRVRWVGGAPSRCRTRRVSFSGSTRSKAEGCDRVSVKDENVHSLSKIRVKTSEADRQRPSFWRKSVKRTCPIVNCPEDPYFVVERQDEEGYAGHDALCHRRLLPPVMVANQGFVLSTQEMLGTVSGVIGNCKKMTWHV